MSLGHANRGDSRRVAGRYRILAQLGEGSWALVHAALDERLGREVALKILRPERLDDQQRARFPQEASLAQRLRHPNTVQIFDYGEDEHGCPFIVFERLYGRTLDAEIEMRGALPGSEATEIMLQVLASLAEAHEAGIVHRDIKPSNIYLCEAQTSGFVKVLDFGVARAPKGLSDSQAQTSEGDVLGTPRYMAPEQVLGQEVTPRTDLYAAGLTLAEMLLGRPVFTDESAIRVCLAQTDQRPVPLPTGFTTPALHGVIAKATAKNPHNRFASALEMMSALRVAAADTTSPAASPAPIAPAAGHPALAAASLAQFPAGAAHQPPARRPPWTALGLGLGAIALVAAAIVVAPTLNDSAIDTPDSEDGDEDDTTRERRASKKPPKELPSHLEDAAIDVSARTKGLLIEADRCLAREGWEIDFVIEVDVADSIGLEMELTRFSRIGRAYVFQFEDDDDAQEFLSDERIEEYTAKRKDRWVFAVTADGPKAEKALVDALRDGNWD